MSSITSSESSRCCDCGQSDGPTRRRSTVHSRLFNLTDQPSLLEFKSLTSQVTSPKQYPLAAAITSNVPIYDASQLSISERSCVDALQDEWYHILYNGPGVFAIRNMMPDHSVIDRTNHVFHEIIKKEAKNSKKGDHFAGAGSNSRIWNSFGKHGLADPESFVNYYSNPYLSLVSEAWLGPAYRITAQVNIVRSGGEAQVSHRDFHLGFQTAQQCARYPAAMQVASQLLTLQGAVAHSDMPVESGPTRLLPFSQLFPEGYMAYRRQDFIDHFLDQYVSLPLRKGDGLFFNPALFHAAGKNTTREYERKANLIQVSSAFGKPMESVESVPLVDRSWDALQTKFDREGWSRAVDFFVKAVADGYPFPTNLDRRPPAPGGMAPESEQDVLRNALEHGWTRNQVLDALRQLQQDSRG